jgi:hypothetical protein
MRRLFTLCTMHHTPARIHIYCAPLAVRDTVYSGACVYIVNAHTHTYFAFDSAARAQKIIQ